MCNSIEMTGIWAMLVYQIWLVLQRLAGNLFLLRSQFNHYLLSKQAKMCKINAHMLVIFTNFDDIGHNS